MTKVAGWAVRDREGVKIKTVSDSRRAAIVNWLVTVWPNHVLITQFTTDQQIERFWERLRTEVTPAAEAVEVIVREKGSA